MFHSIHSSEQPAVSFQKIYFLKKEGLRSPQYSCASKSVEIVVHNRFERKTLTFTCDDGGKADSDFDKHVGSFLQL